MDFFAYTQGLLNSVKPRRDGDLADRLNYAYTTSLLIIFSIFTATWSFVGSPIKCWYPAYFKGWWIQYSDEYCFIQNTYFYPMHDNRTDTHDTSHSSMAQLPKSYHEREEGILPYYQWVPFILALQAFCFYLPMVIWRSCNSASGLCTNTILTTAVKQENVGKEARKSNLLLVAKFMDYINQVESKLRQNNPVRSGFYGRYVVMLYLLVKVLYFLNVFFQFFLMNNFLSFKSDHFWGFGIMNDMMNGRSWAESGRFPRVTYCDFEVRVLGNLHRHTVQCVLLINMFNEKFFLFIWWWLFFVLVVSTASLIQWFYEAITYSRNGDYIKKFLVRMEQDEKHPEIDPNSRRMDVSIDRFIKRSLHADGIFLLKLIAANAGDIVSEELIHHLWTFYVNQNPELLHDQSFSTSSPNSTQPVRLASSRTSEPSQVRVPSPDEMGRFPISPPPRYDDSLTDGAESRGSPSIQTEL